MADLTRAPVARLSRRGSETAPLREFLMFVVGGELFGIELTGIKEILSPPPITPVPRSTREVLGVCSVRGLLVTVLCLRRKLRLLETTTGRRSRILLTTSASGETVGLLVDEVRQVVRLQASEIEPAASTLGSDASEHVVGVARPPGSFVVLLDLRSILPS
ncbi:MAG: cheW3 [Polyangiaceae bacterium]|jgi:purine-binding chemotaxis protein CheW|nr:cheW3 [Polyangiaceae bacterium]